ncbi:MAG: hypothetical protein H0X63_00985 [Flavobacteriales bacterium]|nr:hypothetical protein [Flavobacteriales bacterium]
MAAYNVGLGSIFGGIGAVINKNPEEKTGKVFVKGLWQGAVGGYLIYESKNIISKIPEKEKWEYSWAAKFVNAAGTSIVENAASNRGLWEQWHFHIGFNRIELYTKDEIKIRYKIMPISLVLTGITASKTKFEIKKSLQTGELIFSDSNLRTERNWRAYVLGNIMVVDDSVFDDYFVFAHEIIHIYQYYDYNFINSYTNPLKENWSGKSRTFNKINNLFYFDIQGPILTGLRRLAGKSGNCHFDNFFEYEAEFFAQRGRVICP